MPFSINLKPNTIVEFDGEPYLFKCETGEGFLVFESTRTAAMLRVPTLDGTGFTLPDEPWFTEMLRVGRIAIRSAEVESELRRKARKAQYRPDEIKQMDPKSALRHFICKRIDKARVRHGNKAIKGYLAELYADEDAMAELSAALPDEEARRLYGCVPPNESTVRDWLRNRGQPGERRFADMRRMTGLTGSGKVHPDQREPLFRHALNTYTNRGRKISDGYADFVVEIDDLNKKRPADDQLTPVSYEAFRRQVRLLEERKTVGAKHGKRFVQSRWMGAGQPLTATKALQIAMFDHTPVDMVFCVDGDRGVIAGHPHLGIMVDLYSRVVLHDAVSFTDPTMGDIGRALLGTNTPKVPPAYYIERYPQMVGTYGKPVEVYFDNALYQIARGVEDAFSDAGVDVCYVGVDEPTHKAVIERLLGIIKTLLVDKLPGSTFEIPSMREAGYDPTKHALMTIDEFRVLLKEAIALYHITAHKGLGGRAPLDVWHESISRGRNVLTKDDYDQLRRAVGSVKYKATLDKIGVDVFGLRYADRKLVPELLDDLACLELRRGRAKSPTAIVKIKYDDEDLSSIEVWNERTKSYVTLACTNPEYAEGMPMWLHERIQANAKANAMAFNTKAEQLAARAHFNRLILEMCPEMREREARMLAKLADDPKLRVKGRVDVLVQKVLPSPTGLESDVPNDMAAKTRKDSTLPPIRPARSAPRPSSRDAGQPRRAKDKAPAEEKRNRRDAGQTGSSAPAPRIAKRGLAWK